MFFSLNSAYSISIDSIGLSILRSQEGLCNWKWNDWCYNVHWEVISEKSDMYFLEMQYKLIKEWRTHHLQRNHRVINIIYCRSSFWVAFLNVNWWTITSGCIVTSDQWCWSDVMMVFRPNEISNTGWTPFPNSWMYPSSFMFQVPLSLPLSRVILERTVVQREMLSTLCTLDLWASDTLFLSQLKQPTVYS